MLDLNIPTFLFSIINLVVIYLILKKVLFAPAMKFMEKRRLSIEAAFNEAKMREDTADAKEKEYETRLAQAEQYAKDLYEKAVEKGRNEYESIINEARREAEKIRSDGYEEIEKERAVLYKDIRAQVSKLSILIASKLLKENMDTEKNKALVSSFLSNEDVA
jgi:F-type H+-transporting ATPase subunit b